MALPDGVQCRDQPLTPPGKSDAPVAASLDRSEPVRPEGETLRVERDSELHVALAALAPDGRAALLLAAQGFAGSEIAASIGRTEGATRTLMCRARVQLRQLLDAAEVSHDSR